jgi:hypothetical protein
MARLFLAIDLSREAEIRKLLSCGKCGWSVRRGRRLRANRSCGSFFGWRGGYCLETVLVCGFR